MVRTRQRRRIKKSYRYSWRKLDGSYGGKATFATARNRDAFAREVQDTKASGRDWKPPRVAQALALDGMILRYIEDSKRTCSARTVGNRSEALVLFAEWLASTLGRPPSSSDAFAKQVLESYDKHLAFKGHRTKLEVSSRRIVQSLLYGFWAWAYDVDEWEGIIPMPRRIKMPPPVLVGVRAARFEEIDRMIGALRDENIRRAAVLQRCLGLRIWQVCRLEDAHFDFTRDVLRIEGWMGKSARERGGRDLPIPPALREEMMTWRLRKGRIVNRSVSQVRRAIREAWVAIGADEHFWRRRPSHALRKTFRTELLARDCGSNDIEFWCGRRMAGQADDYTDPWCLKLAKIAEAVPPLALCAQGAPMMRMLFAETRTEGP